MVPSPDARTWPGREALGKIKTVATKGTEVRFACESTFEAVGISPQRFAGGHGSVADYAPLAALEGK